MCHSEGQFDGCIIWLWDKSTKHKSSNCYKLLLGMTQIAGRYFL